MSRKNKAQFDSGAAALWASAFVILAMIIVQAGRVGNEAQAEGMVSSVADLTVLTASAGDTEDILAVLDRRAETMYIYGVDGARSVELYQFENLSDVFTQARGQSR